MRIISFYSDVDGGVYYSSNAERLKKQCESLGLKYTIEHLPSSGDYWKNCLRKPKFILECFNRYNEPLIWLDCDSNLLNVPEEIPNDVDIAGFKIPWHDSTVFMHSYAIYFGVTENVKKILIWWNEQCTRILNQGKRIGDHGPFCDSLMAFPNVKRIWFRRPFATLGMSPILRVPSKKGCEPYNRVYKNLEVDNYLKAPFTIPLKGGLGNVMFQIATEESLARTNNLFPLYYHTETTKKYWDNILGTVAFSEKIAPKMVQIRHDQFHFEPIKIPKNQPTILIGNSYFQSAKYFSESVAKELFSPTKKEIEHIKSIIPGIENKVSIHVRRGDYLTAPNRHPCLPVSYYKNAISFFPNREFIIFSDDIEVCKKALNFIPKCIFVDYSFKLKDYEQLWAMSLCSDNIIANSTFSWWGAFLNNNPSKKIIAPNLWFGRELSHLNTKDIIPETWIKI